jgi:hypothetical protein
VPYFHVVFTLPHELSALVLQNKRLLYDLLFRASAATLIEVAVIRSTLEPTSVYSAFRTPGGKTSSTIPMSIASFPQAACRSMLPDGSPHPHGSSCPSAS